MLPGLIDTHLHTMTGNPLVGPGGQGIGPNGAGPTGLLQPLQYHVISASVNAQRDLYAGFTTVVDLMSHGGWYGTVDLKNAINNGVVPGPRMQVAGPGIVSTNKATVPFPLLESEAGRVSNLGALIANGVEGVREAVREQAHYGVDWIKITTTGGVNSRIGAGLGVQLFDDEVQALIDTATMYGKKVAVHAHGNDGILIALRHGAASVEHGTLMDQDSIALFKKSGAYYVPTLSTINGYKERLAANPEAYTGEVLKKIRWRIDITGKSLRAAHAAGVKIAFGTDAGVSKHGRNADEFELMVLHGMSDRKSVV